jgi:hypothetical protein
MFKLFLLVLMGPCAVWATKRSACVFLFDGKSVLQIEKPVLSHFGLEPIKEQAHVKGHQHALGTTYLISEGAAVKVREVLKNGVITEETFVDSKGHVTFNSWARHFRNKLEIPAESAQELIRQIDYVLREGDRALALAAPNIYKCLEIYEPNLKNKTAQSDVWPQVSHMIPVWTQLKQQVGQEYRHSFGEFRLIFDPKNHCVTWETKETIRNEWERISLFADGTAKRWRNDGLPELISHMDAQIAQGIMDYAYYHTLLGGWNLLNALQKFREFVLAELPELFVSELPNCRVQTVQVPINRGVVTYTVDNTPEQFDPDLGVNQ